MNNFQQKKYTILNLCLGLLIAGMSAVAGYTGYSEVIRFDVALSEQRAELRKAKEQFGRFAIQVKSEKAVLQREIDLLREVAQKSAFDFNQLKQQYLQQSDKVNLLIDVAFSDLASTALLLDAITPPSGKDQVPVSFSEIRIPPRFIRHRPQIRGTSERDEYAVLTSEKLIIDGASISKIDKYNTKNGRRNEVVISAPGLKTIAEDWLEIEADVDLDRIYLDGCLGWSKVSVENEQEIWRATDKEEQVRKLSWNKGMFAEIIPCDNRYHLQRAVLEMPEVWFRRTAGAHDWLLSLKRGSSWKQKMEVSQLFSYWQKNLHSDAAAASFPVLGRVVESGLLEGTFLGYSDLMHGLQNDPKKISLRTTSDFSCESYKMHAPESGKPMLVYGGTGEFNCMLQSYFIFDDDQKSVGNIVVNNSGFLLWMPGEGEDEIRAPAGYSLTVLNRNWGHKKFVKQCADYSAYKRTKIPTRSFEVETFGGVGLLFATNELLPRVVGCADEGEDLKNRISVGDQLVGINGKPIPDQIGAKILNNIKGLPGTDVALSFLNKDGETYNITIKRKGLQRAVRLPPEKISKMTTRKYFENVIVFGAQISEEDLREESLGRWVNVETGDTLEIPPCFAFLFMKETTYHPPFDNGSAVDLNRK